MVVVVIGVVHRQDLTDSIAIEIVHHCVAEEEVEEAGVRHEDVPARLCVAEDAAVQIVLVREHIIT